MNPIHTSSLEKDRMIEMKCKNQCNVCLTLRASIHIVDHTGLWIHQSFHHAARTNVQIDRVHDHVKYKVRSFESIRDDDMCKEYAHHLNRVWRWSPVCVGAFFMWFMLESKYVLCGAFSWVLKRYRNVWWIGAATVLWWFLKICECLSRTFDDCLCEFPRVSENFEIFVVWLKRTVLDILDFVVEVFWVCVWEKRRKTWMWVMWVLSLSLCSIFCVLVWKEFYFEVVRFWYFLEFWFFFVVVFWFWVSEERNG